MKRAQADGQAKQGVEQVGQDKARRFLWKKKQLKCEAGRDGVAPHLVQQLRRDGIPHNKAVMAHFVCQAAGLNCQFTRQSMSAAAALSLSLAAAATARGTVSRSDGETGTRRERENEKGD